MAATLKVEIAVGAEATTFVEVPESPYPDTTALARKRFTVSKDSECVSFRFTQTLETASTEIYALEANVRSYVEEAEGT